MLLELARWLQQLESLFGLFNYLTFRGIPAPQRVDHGERMLICSDGLTGEVADEGIRMTLTMSGRPESAAQALVERAKANGGRDNITVVIVDVLDGGAVLSSDETTNSLLRSASLDGHDTELVDDTIPVRVR